MASPIAPKAKASSITSILKNTSPVPVPKSASSKNGMSKDIFIREYSTRQNSSTTDDDDEEEDDTDDRNLDSNPTENSDSSPTTSSSDEEKKGQNLEPISEEAANGRKRTDEEDEGFCSFFFQ
jgi:hypothetical protein